MENQNISLRYFSLNNGEQIPSLGCGTSTIQFPYENLTECIIEAVKIGYRHIDTADFYKNYHQLKPALVEILNSVKREELFITTKVFNNAKTTAEEDIKRGLEEIGLKYFDLVLIHWFLFNFVNNLIYRPYGPRPIHKFWKNLEKCVKLGYVHSIGLSNFNVQTINDLLTYAKIKPVCNQIEYHVFLQQDSSKYIQQLCFIELVKYCLSKQIQVIAFTPLSKGGLRSINNKPINPFENNTLLEISKKYKKTVAQLILCWMILKKIIPIPKSTKIKNLQENFDCYFKIEEEDIKTINSLNQNIRIADPANYEFADFNDLFA